MVGRARTALFMDVYELPPAGSNPYELEIALIDSLGSGDVPVLVAALLEEFHRGAHF